MRTSLKFTLILFGSILLLQTLILASLRPQDAFSAWLVYIGRSPSGRAYLYQIAINGDQLRQLTDVNSINSTPSLSPDGKRLTYVIRDTVNHRGLWVMDIQSGQRQRFDTNGMALDVAWSPDGEWIAYQTWANGYYVYKMRPDGSQNQTILPENVETEIPIWSPDGEWLTFYSCYLACNIHRQKTDGSSISLLSEDFFVVFSDDDYEWSPDSQFLYIVMSREIWRVSIATGQGAMIGRGQNISIAPDGEWMVYEDRRDEDVFIMKIRTDGGGDPIQLAEGWNPVWSPDGEWIVYGTNFEGNAALFLMRPDGSRRHYLVTVRERFPDPQWGPLQMAHRWDWQLLAILGMILPVFYIVASICSGGLFGH